MTLPVLTESKERRDLFAAPHLSYSRLAKYQTCPEQYRLYYLERLRPRFPSASLVFGQVLHQALAELLAHQANAVEVFREQWQAVKQTELAYKAREPWEKLLSLGEQLLTRFQIEELPKLGAVEAVEKPFSLDVTTLALPFVGFIDLVAHYQGKRTVIDFKTAANAYQEYEVKLADQLT
ncbi:MAG: PD-(D/E)XK nuclease family protein, partial [Planctomycetes bacterium]|nr:PD-(D/E)XK nuclease family protein [Planctomycetota bacterium]